MAKAAPPPRPSLPLIEADDVAALVSADHKDPFGCLGMHQLADGTSVVRAFLPQATTASVIDVEGEREVASLDRIHDAGVFAGAIGGKRAPFPYRLRVTTVDGERIVDDAYRFPPLLRDSEARLLADGQHLRSFKTLGAQCTAVEGVKGVAFAVWAPNAARVAVIGDFNDWDGRCHGMRRRQECGVWEIFVPGADAGDFYKFEIKAAPGGLPFEKADPCAFRAERWPGTASIVCDLGRYRWRDREWMQRRAATGGRDAPISIYEVHLGSWRRVPEEGGRWLTYRELAEQLPAYVKGLGFTHVQLLPVAEHDFDGSLGYHPTALFAPTDRYGTPDDFRFLVDSLHQAGIGVILDWTATGFADAPEPGSLAGFDGVALYEHPDPQQQRLRRSQLLMWDYGRPQVSNHLLANALFWLELYHIDALRLGDLAPILYLDYDRGPGEWTHNRFGGHENLEAVDFLRRLNEVVYAEQSDAFTIAEETSGWPMVSRPTFLGGLGFGYTPNPRWLQETLRYFGRSPIHRKYYQDELTHGPSYAFQENRVLAFSHDLVAHGSGPLISRMPGNHWDKFAHLRLLYAYMFAQPGKKQLFMGDEFAQWREWNPEVSLDWHLADEAFHGGIQAVVRDLNRLYAATPALHERDCEAEGFEWIDANDTEQSVISWLRFARDRSHPVAAVCNFTPVVRREYRVGVPEGGFWEEAFNSDAERYNGSNVGNAGGVVAADEFVHGRPHSLSLTLPPYSAVLLVHKGSKQGS